MPSLKRFLARRWVKIILASLLLLALIVGYILPTGAIHYIEKHDREWLGRDVQIKRMIVNPFRMSLTLQGVSLMEAGSDSVFCSFSSLYGNLKFWHLVKGELFLEQAAVSDLFIHIIQEGDSFNFSDLMESNEADSVDSVAKPSEESIPFTLRNIALRNASVVYTDKLLNSQLTYDSISIGLDSFTSLDTLVEISFRIHQPSGGWYKGMAGYELNSGNYYTHNKIESWSLQPYLPYALTAIRLHELAGELDANMKIAGNSTSLDYFNVTGNMGLSNFKMTSPDQDTLMRLGRFFVDVDSLNTKSSVYDFHTLLVEDGYLKFEYYNEGDNFSNLLVGSAETDSLVQEPSEVEQASFDQEDYYASPFEYLALYIYDLTNNYIFDAYEVDSMLVNNFNLDFYDYTLEDPFQFQLSDFMLQSNDIQVSDTLVNFDFTGVLNRTGTIGGNVLVSREGLKFMEVDFEINGVFITRFSPYSKFYTAHPFWEGAVTFTSESLIKDYYLTSNNHLFIEEIEVGEKSVTSSGYSLPMRLAISLLRDTEGNINLKFPIEGPVNDPNYKVGQIIWQVIKNILVKAATSPYRLLADAFAVNEEDLKTIHFDNAQLNIGVRQRKALDALSKVLEKKPELTIQLLHLYNLAYEKEAMALALVKKDFLLENTIASDTLSISEANKQVSTQDSLFVQYLQSKTSAFDSQASIAENAIRYLGEENLAAQVNAMLSQQKEQVAAYLVIEKNVNDTRFEIIDGSDQSKAINQTHPKFEVSFAVSDSVTSASTDSLTSAPPGRVITP